MRKKTIFRWLKIIIILYSSIGIILFYIQDKLLFHPVKLDPSYTFSFSTPFEEINIPFTDTDTLSLVKFFPSDSVRRGVVVYFHGNKENIERYAKFADNFTRHGYEVWMEDYPGFGKTTGERTEEKMYQQGLQVQKLAAGKYGSDSIIIYGKSFGTGIAAYVAAESNNRRLILETPYYSIPSLYSCYAPIYPTSKMSNYKIPLYKYVTDVDYPVSIFHGSRDGVIPFRNAARLKKVIKPTDEFTRIEKGTHHNLNDFDLFKNKLDSLLTLQ